MNFDPTNHSELKVTETIIPGMFEIDLPVFGDDRGWFKENYQREKLEALGLPHFEIVQNNFSFNAQKGVTRGLHAEPWEKFISLANGRAFGAWVDLRAGASFGQVLTIELNPAKAVFVPRGVANGYQCLDENVSYSYLVNDHWSADAKYGLVSLFDPAININWPIAQSEAIVSDKDKAAPLLSEVTPMEF